MVAGDLVIGVAEDEELVALDIATGEEQWRFNRGRRLQLTAIPSAADGLLYINGRAADGDRLATLFALDLATGEEVWRLTLPDAERMHEWTCPLVADGVVYVAATTGFAFALEAATGEEIWRVEVGNVAFPPPALTNGRLVFLHADGLLVLDAATGEEQWRRGGVLWPVRSVAVADGLVLVNVDQFGAPLYALDLATGEHVWVFAEEEGIVSGEPVVIADGTVYTITINTLFALDLATGEVRWQRDQPSLGAPSIVSDRLYLTFADDLVALDAASGEDIWVVEDWLGDNYEIHSPMVIANGQIFIYAGEGLLAFGAPEDA
jgi:outer membrane protein assembly factor BamB